jgi:unsaturated rhamnogalacturonyl hydrolase
MTDTAIIKNYFDNFLSNYKNYQTYFNYEDGCVLMACKEMYSATGETHYKDFIINYLNKIITVDGIITNYEFGKYNIDSTNSGKLLFFAYDETGDEKYRKAIEFIMNELRNHPRTQSGNFWHKKLYPNQVWLDGLYMAQPFYTEYETRYGEKRRYDDIISQFRFVREKMFDETAKLYYHAIDTKKELFWCDKNTGLSPNFWLRAEGWLLLAIVDSIEKMSPEIFEMYKYLCDLFKEAIDGILPYKTDNMFFQLIAKADLTGNYLETSGSSMVACAIMKGVRLGILSEEKYKNIGREIFESITDKKLQNENGEFCLCDIVEVGGLGGASMRDGSDSYYLSEKRVKDDSKGVGPYIMAFAEYLRGGL